MEITAAILLFIGAFLGFLGFVHLSMDMKVPKMLWVSHLVFVVLGISALIIYAWTTESQVKHYNVLVILGIALIPGVWLLLGKIGTGTKKALSLTYGLIGFFGILWLLTYVIPY